MSNYHHQHPIHSIAIQYYTKSGLNRRGTSQPADIPLMRVGTLYPVVFVCWLGNQHHPRKSVHCNDQPLTHILLQLVQLLLLKMKTHTGCLPVPASASSHYLLENPAMTLP